MHSHVLDAPIKVGSIVTICDGSYCMTIKVNEFEMKHCYEAMTFKGQELTVVAINVPCPTVPCPTEPSDTESLIPQNNCILKSSDGDIVFCSRINIRNTKSLCS